MIIGKADFDCGQFVRNIGPYSGDMHTMARSYCGPFNLNLLLQTVNVVVPTPWATSIIDQVRATLAANNFGDYTDLRESAVCIGGQGNSGQMFRMLNYLDMGIRVHVSLHQPGEWLGERKIKYAPRDMVVFHSGDSNRMWRHVYPKSCEQLVLVFTDRAQRDVPNWKLFSQHRNKGN